MHRRIAKSRRCLPTSLVRNFTHRGLSSQNHNVFILTMGNHDHKLKDIEMIMLQKYLGIIPFKRFHAYTKETNAQP